MSNGSCSFQFRGVGAGAEGSIYINGAFDDFSWTGSEDHAQRVSTRKGSSGTEASPFVALLKSVRVPVQTSYIQYAHNLLVRGYFYNIHSIFFIFL